MGPFTVRKLNVKYLFIWFWAIVVICLKLKQAAKKSSERNCIMGTAFNYPPDYVGLRCFLYTFTLHNPTSLLILFVRQRELNVLKQKYSCYKNTRFYAVEQYSFISLATEHKRMPVDERFCVFKRFLKMETSLSCSNVAIIDTRDSVAQSDLFASYKENNETWIMLVKEHPQIKFGTHLLNRNWATICFGEEIIKYWYNSSVHNSGFAIGPTSEMIKYADIMCQLIHSSPQVCIDNGYTDQAIINFVTYANEMDIPMHQRIRKRIARLRFTSYEHDNTSTMFHMAAAQMFTAGMNGLMMSHLGRTYAIVHQYDRFDGQLLRILKQNNNCSCCQEI